ncbi:MAG TPA: hypothetical protein PLQ13_12710, partial [Candidatus Krumholzibacteria bacterium]|nr:hypothetical protein [Candidatus Krumholzibacteria bacterium]
SGFLSWEATLEGNMNGWFAGAVLMGDAVNAAVEPEFVVGFGTPLPYAQSTVLAEVTVNVVWDWSIALRVGPASSPSGPDNLPNYTTTAEPAVYKPLQYLWGWDANQVPNWSASINDPSCATNDGPSVDAEDATWSGLKALYR